MKYKYANVKTVKPHRKRHSLSVFRWGYGDALTVSRYRRISGLRDYASLMFNLYNKKR